ncbi:GDP-mannose pyrophosphatase NudK [Rouxiella sp. T17]|uniref:GDP-mannose pyrophosphatase NudK n=1 Tax=Rouxiella sp. T17 TaxID=3085684 RepID=UPI002FC835F5
MSAKIEIISNKVLSENWFTLRNYTYDLIKQDGSKVRHKREVYDRGNGATILLFSRRKQTVLLVRQFRMPIFANGGNDGMLIETCAGLLDDDSPEDCIRKEAIEETGYQVGKVEKLFELYMSPGGVTELIHFFVAEYDDDSRNNAGGGVEDEDIDVLEIPFEKALEMIKNGEIKDGKTVLLLQYAQLHGLMNAK